MHVGGVQQQWRQESPLHVYKFYLKTITDAIRRKKALSTSRVLQKRCVGSITYTVVNRKDPAWTRNSQ